MLSPLLEQSALPNLHPALIHFPIALIFVALLFDIVTLMHRRRWSDQAAMLLWGLAALSALAAYFSGRDAVDGLGVLDPSVQGAVVSHADLGYWTMLATCAFAVARGVFAFIARDDERIERVPIRIALTLLALGLSGLVGLTADRGGALVYRHGIAVSKVEIPQEPSRSETTASSAEERFFVEDDGTATWNPAAGDGSALATLVEMRFDGTLEEDTSAEASAEGLTLSVDGKGFLLWPQTLGDVQAAATLDLSSFEGSVGIVHHFRDAEAYGVFLISPEGHALVDYRDAAENFLDKTEGFDSYGTETLVVSSAGSHLKGFLRDEMVNHGHIDAPPDGKVGLFLSGRGRITVLEVTIYPIEEE